MMKIQIGPLVGKGNTADVYDIGDNKVLKLFHPSLNQYAVVKEWENSKLINSLNLPIVKSYDLITYGDRYGIILDKLQGIALIDFILQPKKLDHQDGENYTLILAQIHKRLLEQTLPEATSFKSILRECIQTTHYIKEQSKVKLLEILDSLPEGDQLCHGDFHFGNVIMDGNDYYVIDFMNICKGNKYFDIARTLYLIEMTVLPSDIPDYELILSLKQEVGDIYLNEMGVSREELSDYLTVIAAARLAELNSNLGGELSGILEYLSQKGL